MTSGIAVGLESNPGASEECLGRRGRGGEIRSDGGEWDGREGRGGETEE